jgi:hypothetical protein
VRRLVTRLIRRSCARIDTGANTGSVRRLVTWLVRRSCARIDTGANTGSVRRLVTWLIRRPCARIDTGVDTGSVRWKGARLIGGFPRWPATWIVGRLVRRLIAWFQRWSTTGRRRGSYCVKIIGSSSGSRACIRAWSTTIDATARTTWTNQFSTVSTERKPIDFADTRRNFSFQVIYSQ